MTSSLTADQIEEYRDAFDLFDENKDGKIEFHELAGVTRRLNQKLSDEEIRKWMCSADLDDNGFIDFDEFVQLMKNFSPKSSTDQAEQLKEAFKVFDEDGNGTISADELKDVMKTTMHEVLTEEEVDEMIREIDLDGDGIIDYQEFVTLMSEKKGD